MCRRISQIAFSAFVAFSSATQDITIDAYRIEAEEGALRAMAATYVFGYRLALLSAGQELLSGGVLILAGGISMYGGLMLVGMATTLVIKAQGGVSAASRIT